MRFDRNDYSVPTAYRPSRGDRASAASRRCAIVSGTDVVATHRTPLGQRAHHLSTPATTWPCWSASPGPSTSPVRSRRWELPECFAILRRRLEADLGIGGTREFIKVLRLMEHATLGELDRAVDQALAIGATELPTPSR